MQERSLLDYWLILYQRRVAIYVVILTSIVSSIIIGAIAEPIYEARAALYIPAKLQPVSYVSGGPTATLARDQGTPLSQEVAYKPYLGMLKSLQLAQIVQAQYPRKTLIKLLRSDVDFEVTDELIIRLYSRDPDPVLAADVANAYVAGLNQILSESSQAQVDLEPAYIESALSSVRAELKEAEAELKRYERKHRIASLETELAALSSQKAAIQSKRDDNLAALAANRRQQKSLAEEIRRESKEFVASEVATTSPLIEQLRGQLADVITKLAELESELGNNNVTVIALRSRKQETEQQLNQEIKLWLTSRIKPDNSKVEALRQQLIDAVIAGHSLEATNAAYTQTIARIDRRLTPYPEIKARWTELDQNVDRIRASQKQLRINLTEARLQTDRQMRLVVQLDRAEPPGRPAFPIWWLNALIALFAGALAGIGYAFFLNYVEETRNVRTTRLVRAILERNEARTA